MSLSALRQQISNARFCSETDAITQLMNDIRYDDDSRIEALAKASDYVSRIREEAKPGLMEQFLAEYELSTVEGVALMCLAEAYLRTPDALSLDALIRDKIGTGDWASHLGASDSFEINASTWALMLTGRVFKDRKLGDRKLSDVVLNTLSRVGEPFVQKAIKEAMKILGKQFVLGRNISEALTQATKPKNQIYRYSFDMLGEAARTEKDARKYFDAYSGAIESIHSQSSSRPVHDNPGISVKLSALHPRYEYMQRHQVMDGLVTRVKKLALQACSANIGFTIDAEEADRLELSLDVIETVLRDPAFAGWDGFGVVVQAYSKQAPAVIEWLKSLTKSLGRHITIRLVKGAYWDYEIKQAQVMGLENYPVYTRKTLTDSSYLYCAQQLLQATDVIYPQFATHNAHTTAAILAIAGQETHFEFQRLHGMGETLHRLLLNDSKVPCRVYAPVGIHKDLLAYLVRRLLENGANSSFVNKLLDDSTPIASLIADPVENTLALSTIPHPKIPLPPQLFGTTRVNSKGLNFNLPVHAQAIQTELDRYQSAQWRATPMVAGNTLAGSGDTVFSPSNKTWQLGSVLEANDELIDHAFSNAQQHFSSWSNRPVHERANILEKIADLYQQHQVELMALAGLEAGKTRLDSLLEIREAVDFCRYYAVEARKQLTDNSIESLGPVVCISPWNFPLAIFTGQVAAALVCGNPVLAKPAEQTTLIAARAVELMHEAGVPEEILQLIPGKGATVGHQLSSHKEIKGLCFTGSTDTAKLIDQTLAANAEPDCRFIAETGGLNTMIVDSTALLEQAVRDIIASAYQSAGQRCSALRVLCVQEEIEKPLLEMLEGAAQELVIGNPWLESTDIGPVIDDIAKAKIDEHCNKMIEDGRLLFQVDLPQELSNGHFVAPTALKLNSLDELKQEVFGPVLHVYSFKAKQLDRLVADINDSGFGLTMGIYSRIDSRVNRICSMARVGNMYVNRNQIGAVVGVQPFGGEGLSGTGPKAGGPNYLRGFYREKNIHKPNNQFKTSTLPAFNEDQLKPMRLATNREDLQFHWGKSSNRLAVLREVISQLPEPFRGVAQQAIGIDTYVSFQTQLLTGPTGETNELHTHPRGIALCLGGEPGNHSLVTQMFRSLALGNVVKVVAGQEARLIQDLNLALRSLNLTDLVQTIRETDIANILTTHCHVVLSDNLPEVNAIYRLHLSARVGPRIALVDSTAGHEMLTLERVITTDTTASGGNASLLALTET